MIQLRIAIYLFIEVLTYVIFIRAMLTWFIRSPFHPIFRILDIITDPILKPIRKLLERFGIGGMIDFSSLIALLLLQALRNILQFIL